MADDGGSSLSRRLHWDPESEPDAGGDPGGTPRSEAESWDDELATDTRTEAVPTSGGAVAAGPSFERRQLDRMDEEALDRRRQLWRDTSLLLSGLLVVLILANVVLPELSGTAVASPTAIPTSVVAGGLGTPAPSAGATPEPVATPSPSPAVSSSPATPAPAITQPPTGTAAPTHPVVTPRPTTRPTPRPTPTPTSTSTPTPAPTATPTPAPTSTPTPTPEITPIPPPTVQLSCTVLAALTVSCTSTTTDAQPGSELWAMGGTGTVVAGGDGSSSITFTYDVEGTYHVVLTITGLDGSSNSDGADVTVSAT